MENLLRSKEYWSVIDPRFDNLMRIVTPTPAQQTSLDEAKLKDLKAKNYLFHSIDKTTQDDYSERDGKATVGVYEGQRSRECQSETGTSSKAKEDL